MEAVLFGDLLRLRVANPGAAIEDLDWRVAAAAEDTF